MLLKHAEELKLNMMQNIFALTITKAARAAG